MKSLYTWFTILSSFFFFCKKCISQPELLLTPLTTVSSPVDIANANDGSNRLFLVEKGGRIRIYDMNTSTLLSGNYLDISSLVSSSSEQGLLGLVFHPNYASNGYFYVNYTNSSGDTRISRFTASPPSSNSVSASTELVLLSVDQPFTNHNAGDLAFGPDGYLYIPLGDGGSGGDPGNRAQDPQELLGKMLRIDVNSTGGGNNYAIPPTNPFVGVQSPVDYLDEIWALGLRNPWRFSFDVTGDMWIADVGQGDWEEVNFQSAGSGAGANYGWRCYEGNHAYNTSGCQGMSFYTSPIFEYDHGSGCSITGGYVYRGSDYPSMQGWYVTADYCTENFWLIKPNGGGGWTTDMQHIGNVSSITTFGVDESLELYAASLNGNIYTVASVSLPVELSLFTGVYENENVLLRWKTESEANSSHFSIERRSEDGKFDEIGKIAAAGESIQPQEYTFTDGEPLGGINFYRLKMVDKDDSFKYSSVISVMNEKASAWRLVPNPASKAFSLVMDGSGEVASPLQFQIFDIYGKEILSEELQNTDLPFRHEFSAARLAKGVYFCRLRWDGKTEAQRLVIR